MRKTNYKYDSWPNEQQELLLRAALMQGKDALDAWNRWKSSVDIEKIDHASRRMLPLLNRNLQTTGIDDPLMGMFKGIYRRTWYENQMLFHKLSVLLRSFHDAGIVTMILKGAALVSLHYKDYGLRPMSDIDVLVHITDALPAVNLLSKMEMKAQEAFTETRIAVAHAHVFKDDAGQEFDLHWYILPECRYPHADDDFWDGSVSVKINDLLTYALNPTDQLLHVCVHGAKWNSLPSFRWVADAMTIMNSSRNEIDWNRLLIEAKTRRLVIPLRETLNYLRDVLDAPIPNDVFQIIQNTPISKMERLEYRYKTQSHTQKPLGYLPIMWFNYLRSLRSNNSQHKFFGFVGYLLLYWKVKHQWQLPFYVIFMLIRRIRAITVWYWNRLAKISQQNYS